MSKKATFLPDAALAYAKKQGWQVPKKPKDEQTLIDVMRENMEESLKKIKEKDRFECDRCKELVQEPDTFCWFCGEDLSDDGTGGFKPGQKILIDDKTKGKGEEKKPEKKDEAKDEKPEPKAKEEKKPEKEETKEKKSTQLALPSGEKPIFKKLAEYTEAIRKINASTGAQAWRIGKFLMEVRDSKIFKEGGYESMSDYVQGELEYTWAVARNFMRYAVTVKEEVAEKLGIYKLEILARSPEAARDRMLKAAMPKDEGGQGMNRLQLENKLREEREKNKTVKKDGRGRKPEPNKHIRLADLLGTTLEVRIEDGHGEELIPDSECIVDVKILKHSVKITFCEAVEEEEEPEKKE